MARASTLAPLVAALALAGCDSPDPVDPTPLAAAASPVAKAADRATVAVLATGLMFPRGLAFRGRDVFVAEAGSGGPNATTASQCAQVVPPIGPYT
ncbi:MAG TPA: hypothetical protein VIM84_05190, partial [Gemmatimonadales bacterium]